MEKERTIPFFAVLFLGIGLVWGGIICSIKGWPDVFHGFISGPLLSLLCIAVFVYRAEKMKGFLLSSNLTLFYKVLIPFTMAVSVLFYFISFVIIPPGKDLKYLLAIGGFLICSLLLTLPLIQLRRVSYEEDCIYVSDFLAMQKLVPSSIKSVTRHLFYFYQVTFINENGKTDKIIFLPHWSEVFFNFGFGDPASIQKFRKLFTKEN